MYLLLQARGCLHFRTVPQEHRLINEVCPRRARKYNEENQTAHYTRPTQFITKELYSLMLFIA